MKVSNIRLGAAEIIFFVSDLQHLAKFFETAAELTLALPRDKHDSELTLQLETWAILFAGLAVATDAQASMPPQVEVALVRDHYGDIVFETTTHA